MNKIPQIQQILQIQPDGIWGIRSETALAIAPPTQLSQIQSILGVRPDGIFGAQSQAALSVLIHSAPGAWPFTVAVDGDDLVVKDIVITCFGGGFDPQDTGSTASGVSTLGDHVCGVSLPMRGQDYPHLTPSEHRALDDSPIPRLPWGTMVSVTIGNLTYSPSAGVIDLGPGHQASQPGSPHALDLTPPAAHLFWPNTDLCKLSRYFEARGSYRIHGAAKYLCSGSSAS